MRVRNRDHILPESGRKSLNSPGRGGVGWEEVGRVWFQKVGRACAKAADRGELGEAGVITAALEVSRKEGRRLEG